MKFIILYAFVTLLTGCSTLPFATSLKPHPQQQAPIESEVLFQVALDEFVATDRLGKMTQLQQQAAGSIWAEYAEAIIQLAQRHKQQLAREQTDSQQLTDDLASMQQHNMHLNEKIEQLKTLLIEQEQLAQ